MRENPEVEHLCVLENHRTAGTPARLATASQSSPVFFVFSPVILFHTPVHWVATMHLYNGFHPEAVSAHYLIEKTNKH